MDAPESVVLFKILRREEWEAFLASAEFAGSPVDLKDGFVHLSTAAQAPETARKHFAGSEDLTLAAVGVAAADEALRWEPSRGGALFPHLYRPLRMADVLWARPLPLAEDGTHLFPPETLAGTSREDGR